MRAGLLAALNRALRPTGLVLRRRASEAALGRLCRELRAADARALAAANKELTALRAYLRALDEVLAGVGHSEAARTARLLVDSALGRRSEAA